MKTKYYRAYSLAAIGLVFILALGCHRDEDNGNADNFYQPGDGVTDIDGNEYRTVIIGSQEWMAENLKTTKYRNGEPIPTGLDNTAWDRTRNGAYAIYPHNQIEGLISVADVLEAYGALYNWHAVRTGNLCPAGWRVPTDADWTKLTGWIGGIIVAGGKLKSIRAVPDAHPRWENPNTGETDDYGFLALPGGRRTWESFDGVGKGATWWSTSQFITDGYVSDFAWTLIMGYNSEYIHRRICEKQTGYSVRCLRGN